MDIELISVEADLLLAADSDRQAAYVMEKCAQLGAPVVSRMNVTMENTHLTEIIDTVCDGSGISDFFTGEESEAGTAEQRKRRTGQNREGNTGASTGSEKADCRKSAESKK